VNGSCFIVCLLGKGKERGGVAGVGTKGYHIIIVRGMEKCASASSASALPLRDLKLRASFDFIIDVFLPSTRAWGGPVCL
jgi:hypothetical protein